MQIFGIVASPCISLTPTYTWLLFASTL